MQRTLSAVAGTAVLAVLAFVLNPSAERHRAAIKSAVAERSPVAGALGIGALAAFTSTYHSWGVASYTTINEADGLDRRVRPRPRPRAVARFIRFDCFARRSARRRATNVVGPSPPAERNAMETPLRFACLTVAAFAAAASVPAHSDPVRHDTASRVDAQFAQAARLFRAQHYPEAYGRFVKLANHGHAQSAQMALMMYANGPTVFGSDWDANPDQLQQWKTVAAGSVPALRTAKAATIVR